ncbi:glycosyltransferase [Chloroflexota bacterium]
MDPIASIIVITKDEEKNIAKCLDSLIFQDYPRDAYEIIVVNGASTDRTEEICRRYPVRLITINLNSISRQRNKGIAVARGAYIAFVDADCTVKNTWLRKLMQYIEESHSHVVAVGGPNFLFSDDPALSKVIGYSQETFLGSGGSPQAKIINRSGYVNSIPNCNILYRRAVIAQERYDENLSVGEDCELNFRLRQKGYKFLYLPDVAVWHHRPDSFIKFTKKMFSYGKAMGLITKKHKRIVRWYSFAVALALIAGAFSYVIFKLFDKSIYIYACAICIYVIALLISTAHVHKRYKSIKSLLTLVLLPLQHCSYGFGFLKGLLEFRNIK